MPECRTYSVLIGSAPEGKAALLAEARARAIPHVRGALITGDRLKITVDAGSAGGIAAIASEVRRIFAPRSLPAAAPRAGRIVKAPRASAAEMKSQEQRPSSDADDFEKEFRGHRRSAIISLVCFGAFLGLKYLAPQVYASTGLIRSAAVLLMSTELFRSGIAGAVKERRPNADTLTVTAVTASVLAGKPESSLTLLAISNFSEMLTSLAARRARTNISRLVGLNVRDVWIRENSIEKKVPLKSVRPGMTVLVFTGEKIPVDGTVIEGMAAVDQAALTGESRPADKNPGDRAFAGSVVMLGNLAIRADRVGDDTSLSRIIHMVEDANKTRAPVQNYADHMASMLVPVSFIGALVVYLATRDISRVLNMLFIDFSCGLKLSTATAISAAISRCARSGILIKGGSFIEAAAGVNSVVLDKTGTITNGRPEVVNITAAEGISSETVLMAAASAEVHSTHPLAISVLDEVKKQGLEIPGHTEAETVIGRGIRAEVEAFDGFSGGEVLVGSLAFMKENSVTGVLEPEKLSPAASVIYVSGAGKFMGALEISDSVRGDFRRAINRLRYQGVEEIMMLTGDNREAAAAIASSLGLDGYEAEVLPEDKANIVNRVKSKGVTLMCGDGINDAPALAYADIGVAMGKGCTDTAMETADVTINSDDPLKLPEFVSIGKKTMGIVHFNFGVTIVVNSIAMTLGAMGMITPLLATLVHNASTLGVVLNSSRILVSKDRNYRRLPRLGRLPAANTDAEYSRSAQTGE